MRQVPLPPVGPRLREIREQRGQLAKSVATSLGIPQTTLSAIECGRKVPGLRVICLLAREYQVPLETLFSEQAVDRDAQGKAFVAEFAHRLDSDDWAALRAVALRLARRAG